MTDKTGPWIRPLPERVINKIAAGEVIERPAAVVKELVENSIDAGATRIEIIIDKSGTKLIKIVDNGCGISEEQVEIAFSRHATSKIRNFDDLNNLYTYGFRGEALPSVASISRLRMVTRAHDAKVGTEIIYEGGVLQSRQPTSATPGTVIEVENLFYNTPARRKFLKAETTEARHISRTAMALAISRCDIGFAYTINGRKVFALSPGSTLHDRITGVLGTANKLVKVEGEMGPVKLSGYIGKPDATQNNRYGQFVFINGRYIYSPTLSHAFAAGYGELIARGTYPVGALLLTVDTAEVDVNVHPTKAEVRLSREREVHDAVYRLIKESLLQDGIIPTFRTSTTAPTGFKSGPNYTRSPDAGGEKITDPQMLAQLYQSIPPSGASEPVKVDTETGEVLEPGAATPMGFRLIGRFGNLYLLLQSGDDLYIVDQHTAHERVLFEDTLKKLDKNSVESQTLLFPAQAELNPQQMALFDEIEGSLNGSGFAVSHFGGKTINIEAVPAVLSKKSPEQSVLKILDDIASLKQAGYDMHKAMAQSIACRSAMMAGDHLSKEEAQHLIARLLECENSYSCPHGRPTFIRLTREDLDKQFGRT